MTAEKGWRQTAQMRNVTKTKMVNGEEVTYEVEEEYFMVNGHEMDSKAYFEWISAQDPHAWEAYWEKVNDFKYGAKFTKAMAKCYSDRYPDLKAAFGENFDKLKGHWLQYGQNEKRNKFCYKDMTEEEAQCYIDRYPDIQFTLLEEPVEVKKNTLAAANGGATTAAGVKANAAAGAATGAATGASGATGTDAAGATGTGAAGATGTGAGATTVAPPPAPAVGPTTIAPATGASTTTGSASVGADGGVSTAPAFGNGANCPLSEGSCFTAV